MHARRTSFVLSVLIGLALMAGSAWAADAVVPAHPIPTRDATRTRETARPRRHRRHAHVQLATHDLVARHHALNEERTPLPAPAPRPRRGHRSATVPHVVHRLGAPRSTRSMKGGSNLALAVSSAECHARDVRMLRRSRIAAALASNEHPIVSGRGPPRASPSRPTPLAPSAFRSAPVASRRPGSSVLIHSAPASEASLSFQGFAMPGAFASGRCVFDRGSLLGRLHVRRLEGATTCFEMPSAGGSPCFA